MLRRLALMILHRDVGVDADRLMASHGSTALFVARHAVAASRETDPKDHWSRVRAEIEFRTPYRPF